MKKLLLLVFCFLVITSGIFSQHKKGAFTIGGYVEFENINDKTTNSTFDSETEYNSYGFSPKFGYYITENLQAGIGVGYYHSKNEDSYRSEKITRTINLFTIAPYAKYYLNVSQIVNLFADVSFYYSTGSYKQEVASPSEPGKEEFDVTEYALNLSPGVSIELTKTISIEALIGGISYGHQSEKPADKNQSGKEETETNFFAGHFDFDNNQIGLQITL